MYETVGNSELEKSLEALPDKIADALVAWRKATLDREKLEAILYGEIKGAMTEATATEIKAAINRNPIRYDAVVKEILMESEYTRLSEGLMAAKKRASLRTAF